jgi:CheY-like chemotaxis protein
VLSVDDDKDIREILAETLEERDFEVASAANGVEALAYLRAEPAPLVILLDLMMPVMNGQEFRAEQLRDPALASIPVVVLSADGSAQAKARSLGALTGITKPIRLAHLLAVLQGLAGKTP